MIKIYTDGGYSIPKEIGGWAMVVVDESKPKGDRVIYTENGIVKDTTSNRMEMTAFLTALEYVLSHEIRNAEIITDSNYVVQGFNNWMHGWRKKAWTLASGKPVKNQDLWMDIWRKRPSDIKVSWIKGHAGHEYNELVDSLTRDYM